MIRETVASNVGRGETHADGRPDPVHGAYWDLDLLTPDDVCALLKVKKVGSTTPLSAAHLRPSG
jgi:hypothetical protein